MHFAPVAQLCSLSHSLFRHLLVYTRRGRKTKTNIDSTLNVVCRKESAFKVKDSLQTHNTVVIVMWTRADELHRLVDGWSQALYEGEEPLKCVQRHRKSLQSIYLG